jgi:hypothetical protein
MYGDKHPYRTGGHQMVPNITTILQRFTGEWAMLLQPEAILAVYRELGYTTWRDRVLTPVTTMQLFLLQILHGNTACSHLPHLSGLRFTAAAILQGHGHTFRPRNGPGVSDPSTAACKRAFTHIFDFTNRVTTSLTLVGNFADSRGLAECHDTVYGHASRTSVQL